MNTTVLDDTFRRFLLGIASEEEESLVEQAILAGEVDAALLHDFEDQLIDDYVLGSITPEEKDAFAGHFLAADDRRRRVALAAELVSYARKHAAQTPSMKRKPAAAWGIATPSFWRGAALLATAASILLVALAGWEQVHLRREVRIASETRNELTRMRAAMTTESGTPPPAATRLAASAVLSQTGMGQLPGIQFSATTRSVIPPLLRIPAQTQFVRLDTKLSLPLAARYREVVLTWNGEQLWAQEFPASTLSPAQGSTIALPASILPPGLYHFHIERASSTGHFDLSEDHVFRVVKQ